MSGRFTGKLGSAFFENQKVFPKVEGEADCPRNSCHLSARNNLFARQTTPPHHDNTCERSWCSKSPSKVVEYRLRFRNCILQMYCQKSRD